MNDDVREGTAGGARWQRTLYHRLRVLPMHAYGRLLRTLLILVACACLRMVPLVSLMAQQGLFRLVPLLFPIGMLIHFFAHMIT